MSLFFNVSPAYFAQAVLAYLVSYSLRFDGSGDYLVDTLTTTGNRKTFTYSCWVKRSAQDRYDYLFTSTTGTSTETTLRIGAEGGATDNLLNFFQWSGNFQFQIKTTATITDTEWHHVVLAVDTTQATPADRVKIYLDGGSPLAHGGTPIYMAQNADTNVNLSGNDHGIGGEAGWSFLNGQLAEVHFVDGQALDPTYFGETRDGVWVPKEVTGINYGNNGFYLDFKGNDTGVTLLLDGSAASLTTDASSAGNDPTNSNVTSTTATITGRSAASDVFSFDGTDDYLTLPSNFNGELGEDDFTVECWLKTDTTTGTHAIFDCRQASGQDPGWVLYLDGTSLIHLENSGFNLTATSAITSTTDWYHVALVRSSDTVTMFVDGSSVGTVNVANTSFDFANPLTIGQVSYGGSSVGDFDGLMADIRITKGYARYSDSFTPPTSALSADVSGITGSDDVTLLLDGSSTTDASNAGNNFSLYGINAAANNTGVSDPYGGSKGSFIFDGSGDALTSTNGDIIGIANPFTVEFWVRHDTLSLQNYLDISGSNSGWTSGGNLLSLLVTATQMQLQWWDGSSGNYTILQNHGMSVDRWHHVALVYDGTGMTLYVDGSSIGSLAGTTTDGNATHTYFGLYRDLSSYPFDGRMHDIRITKGAALYPFHPPISALTNTPEYLGDFGVDRTTNNNDFSVEGNISADDQLIDSPNLRFATLSYTNNTGVTLSNANLTALSGTSTYRRAVADSGISSGAYYWEVLSQNQNAGLFVGIVNTDNPVTGSDFIGNNNGSDRSHGWYSYLTTSDKYNEGTGTSFSLSAAVVGDIIRVRFDSSTNTLDVAKNNGSWATISSSVASGTWYPVFGEGSSGNTSKVTFNFGQDHTFAGEKPALLTPYSDANGNGKFYYQPPEGFLALATEYK